MATGIESAKDKAYRANLAINGIVDLVDEEPEVTGGGRGWTATVGEYEAKATSKAEALEALLEIVRKADAAENADEGDDEGDCSDECKSSTSPICQCKCGGANHGGAGRSFTPVVVGDKPCKCGCGEITKRVFVAGHDARYETAQRAKAAGMTVDEFRKSLKSARNKRAAAKRKEVRAKQKAFAERAQEVVAS